jgi:hypothetical protein
MRVAGPDERSIWEPGDIMRIIGWGTTSSGGSTSDLLLEADVPIVTDPFCDSAYGNFNPTIMVCAADPPGTAPGTAHDTCQGDSGGPLLATDDARSYATVGVVSFGNGCANPSFPGVYARIADDPLNSWVNERTPLARFDFDHAPVATQPATLFSTSTHPEGADYFTDLKWDFNQDGQFDDASGNNIPITFPAAGERVIGLEASRPGGDRAKFYGSANVGAPPPPPPPPAASTPPSAGGQAAPPPTAARLATLKSPKRLRARNGRFNVRVSFDASAPHGTAVLTVLLKGTKIGSARVRIRPGGSSIAKVKLTKAGLLKLKRAKKLKVTLRIRVGGKTTRKSLTLRR